MMVVHRKFKKEEIEFLEKWIQCNIDSPYGIELCYLTLITRLIDAYKINTEIREKAIKYIKENSEESYCKEDEVMEFYFNDNTNATYLIDILEGNY